MRHSGAGESLAGPSAGNWRCAHGLGSAGYLAIGMRGEASGRRMRIASVVNRLDNPILISKETLISDPQDDQFRPLPLCSGDRACAAVAR
jgi:hypothetical protein